MCSFMGRAVSFAMISLTFGRRHQLATARTITAVGAWTEEAGSGYVLEAPGVIFSQDDAVAPDLVWVAGERLAVIAADDGKLHLAPDLVVEVLSPGPANRARDREIKLDVYSRYGVREYWVVSWEERSVEVFRTQNEQLHSSALLNVEELLTSPLLPGFALPFRRLFAPPL